MKFTVVEGAVMPKGSMEFTDAKSAAKTPLAKALFKLEGVTRVFFRKGFCNCKQRRGHVMDRSKGRGN